MHTIIRNGDGTYWVAFMVGGEPMFLFKDLGVADAIRLVNVLNGGRDMMTEASYQFFKEHAVRATP